MYSEKEKAWAKAYYEANKDRLRKVARERAAANKEARKEYRSRYMKTERAKELEKVYRERYKERKKVRRKIYLAENKDKVARKARQWKTANRDRVLMHHRNKCNKRLGLTQEQYDIELKKQGGVCLICGNGPGRRRLAIDHDHKTNAFRGLLCGKCNAGLGCLCDNVDLLKIAIKYLEDRKEITVETIILGTSK